MVSSWTFFWLVGGEVIGCQHHQPSGSTPSGVSMFVGSIQLTSPTWWGLQYLQNSSKILLRKYIPSGGTRTLPEGCTTVFLTTPLLPSLISSCLNLTFGTQGRSRRLNEAYFLPTRNGGHRKALVPRCPSRSWFHEHGQRWARKCLVLKEWSGWYDTGSLHCWVNYGYSGKCRL